MNTQTIVSDVRRDVTSTHAVVSNIRDDVANTQTIISEIHRTVVKGQEVTGVKNPSVSVARILLTTESTLIVAQTQTRSVVPNTSRFGTSCLYIACLVNHRPHHQGPVADATS